MLKNFTNILEGVDPRAGLTLFGNTLFGTTYDGGSSGNGTVFKVNTDGSGFAVLKNFTPLVFNGVSNTNSDGANPSASLTLSGSTLYGTTANGGRFGNGIIFSLSLAPPLAIALSETNVILT